MARDGGNPHVLALITDAGLIRIRLLTIIVIGSFMFKWSSSRPSRRKWPVLAFASGGTVRMLLSQQHWTVLTLADAVTKLLGGEVEGCDSDGNEYEGLEALWVSEGVVDDDVSAEVSPAPTGGDANLAPLFKPTNGSKQCNRQGEPPWYANAFDYWEAEANCPASVDGVLGGFGCISDLDVEASRKFLEALRTCSPDFGDRQALDCGAGIGRVTKHLLLPLFQRVDLLEQSSRLIAAAPEFLASEASSRVTYLCQGMQSLRPEPNTYDLVWIQWCIGHLHDLDLVRYLRTCKQALRPGGFVCVKDNFCEDTDTFFFDKQDSSLTRSTRYIQAIFKLADMAVFMQRKQEGFPADLFPVTMFALR